MKSVYLPPRPLAVAITITMTMAEVRFEIDLTAQKITKLENRKRQEIETTGHVRPETQGELTENEQRLARLHRLFLLE